MLRQLSIAAIAFTVLPAAADAQQLAVARATVTQGRPMIAPAPDSPVRTTAAIDAAGSVRDEYGNVYNSRGDRIDRSGRIIAAPVTPPGAPVLR